MLGVAGFARLMESEDARLAAAGRTNGDGTGSEARVER
jgi:hypothetical protein